MDTEKEVITYRFDVPHKLPGLNDYIRACRSNKYLGAKMKREAEDIITLYARSLPPISGRVSFCFRWREGDRRRDLDNVAFAKKFVFDALVKCGILANDNRRHVTGFTDLFTVTPGKWGVEVGIIEEG